MDEILLQAYGFLTGGPAENILKVNSKISRIKIDITAVKEAKADMQPKK